MINYKHRKLQGIISRIEHYGIINVILKTIKFGDSVMWFPKGSKIHLRGFIHSWGSRKRKNDSRTFMGLIFANNIYLKQI